MISCCRVVLHQGQNEHSAIPVETLADKNDQKNRQDQITDVCGHIVIHLMKTFSAVSAILHPQEKEIVYQPV
ncbi:MAG: hypothetical protein Q8939_18420, partial [Bacteroidota bacterium]|nr:hypothetical protein [Bacteroidota bacterium]